MLPKEFDLEKLDEGIRNLVININRIPEVDTETTCEGYIWEYNSSFPTKFGWIHFNRPTIKRKGLIQRIKSLQKVE